MNDENIYTPPFSNLEMPDEDNLATRWTRLWGALIDAIISSIIMIPVMFKTTQIQCRVLIIGKPQQKAYIERHNRTIRYSWVSKHLFDSLEQVQN